MTATQTIPEAVANRLVAAVTGLVSTAREAVAASSSPQAGVWQRKVLPLLEGRLAAAKTAAAHFAIGDEKPLVEAASPLRFLARDMDGYALNFAGDDLAKQLEERQRLVVLAAWQVCQSAGIV